MTYTGEYKNINGDDIIVEIITDDKIIGNEKLLLAENAVTITSVSDGLFSPIKSQSATIRILTNKLYSEFYSNTDKHCTVIIGNKTKRIRLFKGYVTPNIYNQEYEGLDELEIEAVSGVSILKNKKYVATNTIVSWYDLIRKALREGGYTNFTIADSYKIDDKTDFIKELYQFEGNFFDNDEEKTAWSYYDILEEFCKYFCLSLVVFEGEVYFIDYNNLRMYKRYDFQDNTVSVVPINKIYIINADSYKSTGTNISYDETFNKVSVKCNLYNNDMEQDPIKDEDLVNMDKLNPNRYYQNTTEIEGENYTYLNGYFGNEKWENYNPDDLQIVPENIEMIKNISFWQKVEDYKSDDVPSSLSWETYLTAYNDGKNPDASQGTLARMKFDIIRKKVKDEAICNGGYFILNLDYKLSTSFYANDCIKTKDYKYEYKTYNYGIPDVKFPCKLQIGNYFYNGTEWSTYDEINRKQAKGYFRDVFTMGVDTPRNYYKYKDADGDWAFCLNKKEWDNLPEGTIKESGQSIYNQNSHVAMQYWVNQGVGKPPLRYYIDENYYNECILRDRFYIIHRNKEGDKIFDEIKSLKNTASWEMNIEDSEDGVAIALPNKLINGKLDFSITVPDVLGTYPQGRIGVEQLPVVKAVHIKKCRLVYRTAGKTTDIFDLNKDENDVIYTNIIDEDYVNEWDDLELKVNTQVEDKITSYSSILKKSGNYFDFIDKIKDLPNNIERVQEESIIDRFYNHYNSPKLILQATLENKLTPFTVVSENNLNKNFIVDSYELDVNNNSMNVKLIEL